MLWAARDRAFPVFTLPKQIAEKFRYNCIVKSAWTFTNGKSATAARSADEAADPAKSLWP